MKTKSVILGIFILLLIPLAFAQQEGSLCTAEPSEDGRSCEDAEALMSEQLDERFWETYSQLPTKQLRRNYMAEFYILPKFNNFTVGVLIACLLITGLIIWRQKPKSWGKKFAAWKNYWQPVLATWVILFILLGLLFSWAQYYKEGAEQGIIICKSETECEIAMHVHAYLDVTICGEEIAFPAETGDLSMVHTHKERNKLHWHDIEAADPITQEVIDPYELTLEAFFEQMGEEFKDGCIMGMCEGVDTCPGSDSPGTITMTVEGQPSTEFEKYYWQDEESITLSFE